MKIGEVNLEFDPQGSERLADYLESRTYSALRYVGGSGVRVTVLEACEIIALLKADTEEKGNPELEEQAKFFLVTDKGKTAFCWDEADKNATLERFKEWGREKIYVYTLSDAVVV